MNLSSVPVSAAEIVRAERFESSLHARLLGRAGALEAGGWRLIHIAQGRADLLDGGEVFPLEGPCVTWQPWHRDMRARIAAGAVGAHVLLGAGVLANAIGHKPESPELRFMTDRRAHVSLADMPEFARVAAQSLEIIVKETYQDGAAARTVIEAALRVVLVHLWRAQGAPQESLSTGATTRRYIGQFNNLVEVHYRERWNVGQYARALGITTDRLNDICQRARGRTPREIIAARVIMEARLLLENSLHSLDEIASQLGFPGTAQFNRYFKKVQGIPPGQYRRQHLQRTAHQPRQEGGALFDWP